MRHLRCINIASARAGRRLMPFPKGQLSDRSVQLEGKLYTMMCGPQDLVFGPLLQKIISNEVLVMEMSREFDMIAFAFSLTYLLKMVSIICYVNMLEIYFYKFLLFQIYYQHWMWSNFRRFTKLRNQPKHPQQLLIVTINHKMLLQVLMIRIYIRKLKTCPALEFQYIFFILIILTSSFIFYNCKTEGYVVHKTFKKCIKLF